MPTPFSTKLPALAALLALPILLHAQDPATPAPVQTEMATTGPVPRPYLLKIGFTPSRLLPEYRYDGLNWVVAPSLGAEYQLGRHVNLYGQADVDFAVARRYTYYGGSNDKEALVHSGAVGLGVRYYYNQAGRERHNRAHGPFMGNYLALESTVELYHRQFYSYAYGTYPNPTPLRIGYHTELTPLVNLYWGMQRRVGQHFLYDVNAGIGVLARPTYYYGYYYAYYNNPLYRFTPDLAINLRLYFVR